LAQFFWFWLGFFWFGSVFFRFGSVFFPIFFVWVRFGSVFWFQAYKTSTEPVRFFKILIGLIGFFHGSVIFFSGFLDLIGFLVFLLTPISI
jgi:hypothetical protein